jgi:hypothetical protein
MKMLLTRYWNIALRRLNVTLVFLSGSRVLWLFADLQLRGVEQHRRQSQHRRTKEHLSG